MTNKRNNGMTLIELMFAAGIVAMALAMLFGSLLSLSLMGQVNKSRMDAIASLNTIMEQVNTLPYEALVTFVPPVDSCGPGVSRQVSIQFVVPGAEGTDPSLVSIPLPAGYANPIPNPVEVRVTLAWQEQNGYVFQIMASTMKGR